MRRTGPLLVLLCLVSLASRADATVLVPIDFGDLVSSAPVIVHAVVLDVRSDWVDGRRAIETYVTLDAREYVKGNLGSRITIRVPGGELGRYRTVFVGAPRFHAGDEVMLFLQTDPASLPHIVGLNQGLVRIATDDATRRRFAIVPPGVRRIDRLMALDAFESTLRQAVRRRGATQR